MDAAVNPELIRRIPHEEQGKRGWKLVVNGIGEVPGVMEASLRNEKMGVEVRYGMRAEGYDGVVIHEPGGGGSVLVPYVIYESKLWVALLKQVRRTQCPEHDEESTVSNLPRGYMDPGKTHFETASQEMREESGVLVEASRIVELSGTAMTCPANPNSAYFDTSKEGEGVHFYGVRFSNAEVEKRGVMVVFREGMVSPVSEDRLAERILSCHFYPWWIAAEVGDMFTNAGVARLMSHLRGTGELQNANL